MKYRLQKVQPDARENLNQCKINRTIIYDETLNPITYKKEDLVLLKNQTGDKLYAIYTGLY